MVKILFLFLIGLSNLAHGVFVYVTNQQGEGTVSIINTFTQQVILTLEVGADPQTVTSVDPGVFAFVTNLTDGTVSKITSLNQEGVTTFSSFTNPYGAVLSPDLSTLYITQSVNPDGTVLALDSLKGSVLQTIPVGRSPEGIAVSPDGLYLSVANNSELTVSIIDTQTWQSTPVTIGTNPSYVVMDNQFAYASGLDGNVHQIHLASKTKAGTIAIGDTPSGMALSPDGSTIYVTNGASPSGALVIANTSGGGSPISITAGNQPVDVALVITPTQNLAYVCNTLDNTVTVIDLDTKMPVTSINVGANPSSLSVFSLLSGFVTGGI